MDSRRAIPELAVSPDQSKIVWRARPSKGPVRGEYTSDIRVHDAASGRRTVATEGISGGWDERHPSFEGNLLWISTEELRFNRPSGIPPDGWKRFSHKPYLAGEYTLLREAIALLDSVLRTKGFTIARRDRKLVAATLAPDPGKTSRNTPLEGTVLDVLVDGMIEISLGTDNGLKVGDVLHVWRPAQGGSVGIDKAHRSGTSHELIGHKVSGLGGRVSLGGIALVWSGSA